jgi:hypothetical protein
MSRYVGTISTTPNVTSVINNVTVVGMTAQNLSVIGLTASSINGATGLFYGLTASNFGSSG